MNEKMAVPLILTSSRYQVLWEMRTGVYQHFICCTVYLWKVRPRMIETFCEGRFTECFHFCVCVCAQLDFLSTSFIYSLKLWAQLQSSYFIVFSCLFAHSRFCYTHFSYYRCKIHVSCHLTQITKKQRDPCHALECRPVLVSWFLFGELLGVYQT